MRTAKHFILPVLILWALNAHALESFRLQPVVNAARSNLVGQFTPTGLSRTNYLEIISGIVSYFRHFQDKDGRIIDPFLQKEFQYATPCYAWATASLVSSGRDTNLLESAAAALECSVKQLADDKAASNHGDFFTFPCILAYEALRDRLPAAQRLRIEDYLRRMKPEECYEDVFRPGRSEVHNWNVVALSGEFLRYQNGFTDLSFVEKHLPYQMRYFIADGLYRDPNNPMAYDHFPRHFLAAMVERGYEGSVRKELIETLDRGAWVSLLMQSPAGELPTGGRSAQHQWNEAEQCVTFEIWAKRKQREGDPIAGKAFKRAAHLSAQSIQRWIRPSGELWIVKNRFDPGVRHGFQSYSSHSQYNLLAASMLATAWLLADDSIEEGPAPADRGGFAFAIPEFHKVFANAGGLYLEIDTAADPEYNSTGLIRVHKQGVNPLIGPSDSSPASISPLATGIGWKTQNGSDSLAAYTGNKVNAGFNLISASTNRVKFKISYKLDSTNVTEVIETYDLTPEGVDVTAEVKGNVRSTRVRFPALSFNGQNTSTIVVDGSQATVSLGGSEQTFAVEAPSKVELHRTGQWIPCRNGYLEAVEGEVRGKLVRYSITPRQTKTSK